MFIGGQSTRQWLEQQLARFTYKPGWKLQVIDARLHTTGNNYRDYYTDEQYFLGITAEFEDTYHPGQRITVGGTHRIWVDPFERNEQHFARQVQQIIHDLELHESREWLRRDGELFDNPHKPLNERSATSEPRNNRRDIEANS